MKKIITILSLSIVAIPSFAGWVAAGNESDGAHFYDPSTIKVNGKNATMLTGVKAITPNGKWDTATREFTAACGSNSVQYGGASLYKNNQSIGSQPGSGGFTPISAGGEGAAVDLVYYKAACGK